MRRPAIGQRRGGRDLQLDAVGNRVIESSSDTVISSAQAPSILVTLLNPLEADGLVAGEHDPGDSASRAQKETEDALFASLDGLESG